MKTKISPGPGGSVAVTLMDVSTPTVLSCEVYDTAVECRSGGGPPAC